MQRAKTYRRSFTMDVGYNVQSLPDLCRNMIVSFSVMSMRIRVPRIW